MTQTDPSTGRPYPDQHSTPTQIGSPYGGQNYGGQNYGGQNYGGSYEPAGPPGYPPPSPQSRSRFGPGAVVGVVVLIAALVAGLGTGAYFLLRPSSTASPAPVAAAPPVPAAAPPAAAATTAPPSPTGVTGGTASLSQVFPASTGSGCVPYTPAAGEYVTSTGRQATEVRACAPGSSGQDGVVYTRWGSPADAASVVSDQARTTTSVNDKNTWTMGGTTEGDYHEARQSDGSCRAFLDYTSAPYAVVFSAPTCSGVEQLFQDTTLPDAATLPR